MFTFISVLVLCGLIANVWASGAVSSTISKWLVMAFPFVYFATNQPFLGFMFTIVFALIAYLSTFFMRGENRRLGRQISLIILWIPGITMHLFIFVCAIAFVIKRLCETESRGPMKMRQFSDHYVGPTVAALLVVSGLNTSNVIANNRSRPPLSEYVKKAELQETETTEPNVSEFPRLRGSTQSDTASDQDNP